MIIYKKFLVVAPDMYAANNYIRGSFDTKEEAEVFAQSQEDRTHTEHYIKDKENLDPNNEFDKDYIREMAFEEDCDDDECYRAECAMEAECDAYYTGELDNYGQDPKPTFTKIKGW